MLMLQRTDITNMELSNSRYGAIAESCTHKLPLHSLMRIGIGPVFRIDAAGNFPDRTWPLGADWEITYGVNHPPSLEQPDTNIGPYPDVHSAWKQFCALLKRTCICAEIWFSFVEFTPQMVEMFTDAEKTGNIMRECRTIAAGGTNEDLFRESITSTDGFDEDYRIHLSDDE